MKITRSLAWLPLCSLLALASTAGGCAAETGEDGDAAAADDDLTSLTARSRDLAFEGVVYVAQGSSDTSIINVIHEQVRTAFGPLREGQISVNSRELKQEIDPKTLQKKDVRIVDTALAKDAGRMMTEVRYLYQDAAVVAKSLARRTAIPLAVVNRQDFSLRTQTLAECTNNDQDAHDFPLWYEFKPQLASCKAAISAEQTKINADRALLPTGTVPKSQVDRVYLPITVKLGADKTNKGNSYPEYDRLFAGGVLPNKLVVALAYGMIDHQAPANGPQDDSGYGEWMANLGEIFTARPGYKLVHTTPSVDVTQVVLSTGKTVTGLGFEKFIEWNQRGTGFPVGLTQAEKAELQKAIGQRLYRHYFTFEAPAKVTIGANAEKDFAFQIFTYFGVEADQEPHKVLIKHSDVYLYNGHSMIGSGPLDPRNFTASDFPASYQLLFIDGCVSYNYYEKDYFPMKGGTQNLDLITNGLEAPSGSSGLALGRFVAALTSGAQPSYSALLGTASVSDSGPGFTLRVVDGEIDNRYNPKATPIKVR